MKSNLRALLFVIERFAVWSYLNFRLLPVRIDLSLVGHELVLFGEGFALQNFSFTGLGLQSRFDYSSQGIQRHLLLSFDDGRIRGHRNVPAMACYRHYP